MYDIPRNDRTALELVQAWYAKPDADLLSADFECTAVGYPTAQTSYSGVDGMLNAFFGEIGEKYDLWSLTVDRMIDAGADVTVLGNYTARPVGGSEATLPFAHVWTAEDGVLRSVSCFTDAR